MRNAVASATLLFCCTLAGCDAGTDDTGMAADSAANPFGIPRNTDDIPDSAVAQGPITTNDGCRLAEESAIEQAIGMDVVMNDNTTGNCVLTPASGNPAAPTFDLRIEPRTNAFDYFSAQPDASPIAGLGERAVWATLNETTGYIVVVRRGQAIVVAVARPDGVTMEQRRQAEALARLLL